MYVYIYIYIYAHMQFIYMQFIPILCPPEICLYVDVFFLSLCIW